MDYQLMYFRAYIKYSELYGEMEVRYYREE
jgi:hypothetical protein